MESKSSINNLNYSVVIPMYNAEETIISCLESVVCQDMLPSQVIIVDDGSSDNSHSVVENFISRHNEFPIDFILLNQKNSGPSQARNLGVLEAKGSYIAFLDSDDRWDCNKMTQQLHFIQEHTEYKLLGMGGEESIEPYRVVSFKQLIYKNYFQTSTVLVARDVLIEYPFDVNQKYSEDYKVWLQVVNKYNAALVHGKRAINVKGLDLYANSGLSSRLKEMVIFELANFRFLRNTGAINYAEYIAASTFSLIKYIRRLFIKNLG